MGLFEFLFGDSGNQNRKYRNKARDQEMANMYDLDGMKWKILNMIEKL